MKWPMLSLMMLGLAVLACLGETYFGIISNAQVAAKAIKALYELDAADLDAFYNSYDVFDKPKLHQDDEAKVNSYYKVLMPLLELGGLRKFYIPPLMDASKTHYRHVNLQQELFERKMADELLLAPGKVALDVGCGQGLIADVVQEHTGAKVVGMNISPEQIGKARDNAQSKGKLGTLLEFNLGSMNDDPFPYPDKSFDAVYSVQTMTYTHNLTNTMREVRRVLKPGGMFTVLDGMTMSSYNANNTTQYEMAQKAKRVGGIPIWRSVQDYEHACVANGLSLKISKHMSHADLMQATTDFFKPLGDFMKWLHNIGLVGKSLMACMDRMNEYVVDLIEGDRQALFTTDYWIVAQG